MCVHAPMCVCVCIRVTNPNQYFQTSYHQLPKMHEGAELSAKAPCCLGQLLSARRETRGAAGSICSEPHGLHHQIKPSWPRLHTHQPFTVICAQSVMELKRAKHKTMQTGSWHTAFAVSTDIPRVDAWKQQKKERKKERN